MTNQFLRLYIIITASLIFLVVVFGQLYNHFFQQATPTIQFSVDNFQQLIANKDQRITEIPRANLALPVSLQNKLDEQGILTVSQNGQEVAYLLSERRGFIYRVGPFNLTPIAQGNTVAFFAFYALLAGIVLLLIRPVFRDLSTLQAAANEFSQRPKVISPAIKRNSSIAPLAETFTNMSQRIEHFIHLHRDLSRIISHEIRTPLTRMQFALSLTDDDEISQQIQQDVEEIELRLDQYLHFARIEHQHQHFIQKQVDALALINTEVKKYKLYNNLNISHQLQVEIIFCEQNYMAIALQNLLVNACKYAKHNIVITLTKDEKNYYLSVEDDGPGLPVNATSLFEPFLQGENDNLASGYGLGLYIVKRIISWHSGSIKMENNIDNQGSKVTLSWPKPSSDFV